MSRPRSGVALVEILLGLGLTTLLLQALFPLLATSLLAWNTAVARLTAHQTARMAMESMTRELRLASAVSWPPPGQADSRIQFQVRQASGQVDRLTFQLGSSTGQNGRTLYRVPASGQPSPLTQDMVDSLVFLFQPPGRIRISLTVIDPTARVAAVAETSVTCLNLPD